MSKKINIHVELWEGCLQPVVVTGLKDDEYDLEITEDDSIGDEPHIHTINGVPVLEEQSVMNGEHVTKTVKLLMCREEQWFVDVEVPEHLENHDEIVALAIDNAPEICNEMNYKDTLESATYITVKEQA